MANNYFLRKVTCDELMDTLFFSTGNRPTKTKSPDSTTLSVDNITVVVRHNKSIKINGDTCKSITQAKIKLQNMICL